MSKYVRTKDGILTAEKFIHDLLIKNGSKYVTKRDNDELGIGEYYEYTSPSPTEHERNNNIPTRYYEVRVMTKREALQMVEETPNRKADTIEELCDCYLEDWGKDIPHIVTKHMMSVWSEVHKGKALRGETTFYACIIKRDGKGTHIEPVAKMNEKGEFELL